MSRIHRIGAAIVLLATMGMPGIAGADHYDDEGSISGTVTDGSGSPLAGICVTAYEYYDEWDYWEMGWAETGPDGTYTIEYLYEWDYLVRFQDCNDPATYASEWYDDAPNASSASPVTVVAGAETTGIDASLAVGGSISGTVVDEDTGEPIRYLCVSAGADGDTESTWTSTDESGAYRLGGLASGNYRVHFGNCDTGYLSPPVLVPVSPAGPSPSSPPVVVSSGAYVDEWYDDKPTAAQADLVPVVQGVDTIGIDAALVRGGSIEGTVTDEDGRPVDGVCVYAVDAATGDYMRWTEAWGGDYRIEGLRGGTYKVRFEDCWEWLFMSEWFDDKPTFASATPVDVVLREVTPFIDAILARRPMPDLAVTDLKVQNVPLQTDDGELIHTGWVRDIDVEVANLGDASPWYGGYLEVWVQMGDGSQFRVAERWMGSLGPGEVFGETYRWSGMGAIGDATVHAQVCAWDDRSFLNNRRQTSTYVMLGGSGLSSGGMKRSDRYGFGCYWYEDWIVEQG